MKLNEWLQKRGRGEPARIVREANVSFSTVRIAAKGELTRSSIAERISAATGGVVKARSLMVLPRERSADSATAQSA